MSAQSSQDANIFKGFSEWFKTAKVRNPQTNLDEARLFVMFIFWGITVYILGTGLYYHYEIFKVASSSGWFAVAISAVIFFIGEVGKYKLFTVFLWGLFSSDIVRSGPKFGAYAIMFLLTAGFYYWSWNISTNAAPTLNALMNKTANSGSIAGDSTAIKNLESELALVTTQINDVSAKEKGGFAIKYKGVTTQEGQAIAKSNAKSKDKLIDQQGLIRQQLLEAKNKMESYRTSQYDLAATQLSEYGGYAELAQLMILLINSLILIEIYDRNRKPVSPTPSTEESEEFSPRGLVIPSSTAISPEPKKPVNTGKYKYLQGYIFVKEADRYYNPSEFLVWLRNSHKRGNSKVVESLKKDILVYLQSGNIDPKITTFIEKHPDIVGEEVVNTASEYKLTMLSDDEKIFVLHEAGHFVAYCHFSNLNLWAFRASELYANVKENKGYFSFTQTEAKMSYEAAYAHVIQRLAGLATEYTQTYEHTENSFFADRVVPYDKIKGSDTEQALTIIKMIKKESKKEIELIDCFFEAVDLMLEYKEKIVEVAKVLSQKGKLNNEELTQLAHDLNLIEK